MGVDSTVPVASPHRRVERGAERLDDLLGIARTHFDRLERSALVRNVSRTPALTAKHLPRVRR
jgi:hypothetical protein